MPKLLFLLLHGLNTCYVIHSIVTNRKCGHVMCHCRKAWLYRFEPTFKCASCKNREI